ncbi:MAG: hypothetical protein E7339_02485 [Clostridiales bacterium]|nr:hypothetical protein [Clostridiales bacterium]
MSKKMVVCDSGVGGLAVLIKLVKAFPSAHFYYLSDLKNMPYGSKSKEELISLLLKKISFAKRVKADCLVIACNTLATVGAEAIKKEKKLKIFSILPPVEKIADFPLEKTRIFCTPATAKSKILSGIIAKNGNVVIPFKSLAEEVEKNIFNLQNISTDFLSDFSLKKGRIYLSCTHYIHLANLFKIHFPTCEIFDGTEELINELNKEITFLNNEAKKGKIFFRGTGKRRIKRAFYYLLRSQSDIY